MSGALAGVRIVDMTSIGMGPMATQLLGDMGADVIKVETAGGDVFRHVTPQRHQGMSHAYLNLNRNKRSVVLDAKSPAGRERERSCGSSKAPTSSSPILAAPAPWRPPPRAETLRAEQPRLIYCGCYGYSEQGPYAGRTSLDDVIQAACGMAWFQGVGADQPRYVNSAAVDKTAASTSPMRSPWRSTPAKRAGRARRSRCRCSRPWSPSCSPSISAG